MRQVLWSVVLMNSESSETENTLAKELDSSSLRTSPTSILSPLLAGEI
ncbi:hypothetical protein [Methylobacter sp. BBA5.1]|nr:hypothetical protein [Methylobacter sp. BBA5.1]